MRLTGKKVLLAVTGGIAAYKSISLLRLLTAEGADVRVIATPSAVKIAGFSAFETFSGRPLLSEVFSPVENPTVTQVAHIEWARWADLVLVAPCTAHTAAKLAAGFADDLLSLVFLATKAPRVVVPAMNCAMYESASVRRSLETLKRDGVSVVEAGSGFLACGETGKGRMPEPEELLEICFDLLSPAPAKGTVVVVAGRTEEPIDPVRVLTNRSSGKTGLEIACAFRAAGWKVKTVLGPCETPYPAWCDVVRVRTALEMEAAAKKAFRAADAAVMVAAVADFRPAEAKPEKIKRSRAMKILKLVPNPDILAELSAKKKRRQVVAGFALETVSPMENGAKKILAKGCDLMAVNDPTARGKGGFGEATVECALLRRRRDCVEALLPLATRGKGELAAALAAETERILAERPGC